MAGMQPISYPESQKALQRIIQGLRSMTESLPVRHALFRILASPVYANVPNPAAAVSAMDGIAVNSSLIPDALVRLRQDQWQFINTGEVLPPQMNSVIKIEDVQWEDGVPVLDKKPNMLQNVRQPGEDFEKGAFLLTAEHQLYPQDLSLLLASGCESVEVFRKPIVNFIPTGTELVNTMAARESGKILETNSAMVAGLVQQWGGDLRLTDLVPDDADDLAQWIKISLKNSDVIVISAGTSKGTKDITADVLALMGKVYFHGVMISPGKPVLLGAVSGIPVLGLPGYPAAAYVCSQLYLRPLVCALSHIPYVGPRSVYVAAEEIGPRSQDSFYRVNTFEVDGQTYVRRIEGGAGSIASISGMDGILHVPPQTAIKKRDGVRVDVIHDRAQNTIAAAGTADTGITHLFSLLRKSMPTWRLLFWPLQTEDSLQSIVERNAHFAVIGVPDKGRDPIDLFTKQLQEPMHRYRAFSRTSGILLREPTQNASLKDLPQYTRIAIPKGKLLLWQSLLNKENINPDHFQIVDPGLNESQMADAFTSAKWDAILVDVRFLKDATTLLLTMQEHLDLVIPESHTVLPPIRKLIELLLSEEFWMWVETQTGCNISQRGPID